MITVFTRLPSPRTLVLGTFAAILSLGICFVGAYGRNLPHTDDYVLVPVVSGLQPIRAAWFWEQHNEHRFPLGRVIILAIGRLTQLDTRAAMFLNVLLLALGTWLAISSTIKSAGRYTYSACLFPLLLLNWGHWYNLLMAISIYIISATVATIGIFCFVLREGWRNWWGIAGFLLCQLVLTLSGGSGLPIAAGYILFSLCVAGHLWRLNGRGDRIRAVALFGIACLTEQLIVSYFHNWVRPFFHPEPTYQANALLTGCQFLAGSLGPAATYYWQVVAAAMLGALFFAFWLLARASRAEPGQQLCAAGLTCGLISMCVLALAVGYSRSDVDRYAGLEPRYYIQAVPMVVVLVMIFQQFGRGRARLVTQLCTTATVSILAISMLAGRGEGAIRAHQMDFVLHEIERCGNVADIARKYYVHYFPFNRRVAAQYLWVLCHTRTGPYSAPNLPCSDCGEVPFKGM